MNLPNPETVNYPLFVPVRTFRDARLFLRAMKARGWLWHLDDSAGSVITFQSLPDATVEALERRRVEILGLPWLNRDDPYQLLLTIQNEEAP
jgi:hypothetical protein